VISFSKDDRDDTWECDAVAICSGLHVKPDIPFLDGVDNVPKVMHSSEFKSRSDFGEGKNVMILGAGETAMDLAYLAVTSPVQSVTLCHRDGFFYAPKVSPSPSSRLSSDLLTENRGYPCPSFLTAKTRRLYPSQMFQQTQQ
jgi:dimethylaniline monooxygenase (N-oxide forming)